MRIIYEPKGWAAEYASLACNLYGDANGKKGGCSPKPKPGVLEKLELDARDMAANNDTRRILYQFIGDPYCPNQDDMHEYWDKKDREEREDNE